MLAMKREEAARTPGARVASRGLLERDSEVDSPLESPGRNSTLPTPCFQPTETHNELLASRV